MYKDNKLDSFVCMYVYVWVVLFVSPYDPSWTFNTVRITVWYQSVLYILGIYVYIYIYKYMRWYCTRARFHHTRTNLRSVESNQVFFLRDLSFESNMNRGINCKSEKPISRSLCLTLAAHPAYASYWYESPGLLDSPLAPLWSCIEG